MATITLTAINGQTTPFVLDLALLDAAVQQDFTDYINALIEPLARGYAVVRIEYQQ